jgi:ankyrin repeat protein
MECAQVLLAAHADRSARNSNGKTAADEVTDRGLTELTKYLRPERSH